MDWPWDFASYCSASSPTVASWTAPLFRLDEWVPTSLQALLQERQEIVEVSTRDLILFFGGLFLIYQSVREIHHLTAKSDESEVARSSKPAKLVRFSFKSPARHCLLARLSYHRCGNGRSDWRHDRRCHDFGPGDDAFFGSISHFVMSHPSVKVLALSFLLMIGVMLLAEGLERTSTRATSTLPWLSRLGSNC